jgi:hypothetical protein
MFMCQIPFKGRPSIAGVSYQRNSGLYDTLSVLGTNDDELGQPSNIATFLVNSEHVSGCMRACTCACACVLTGRGGVLRD